MWCQTGGTVRLPAAPALTCREHEPGRGSPSGSPVSTWCGGCQGLLPRRSGAGPICSPCTGSRNPWGLWLQMAEPAPPARCRRPPARTDRLRWAGGGVGVGWVGAHDSCPGCSNACLQRDSQQPSQQRRSQRGRTVETVVTSLHLTPCHPCHLASVCRWPGPEGHREPTTLWHCDPQCTLPHGCPQCHPAVETLLQVKGQGHSSAPPATVPCGVHPHYQHRALESQSALPHYRRPLAQAPTLHPMKPPCLPASHPPPHQHHSPLTPLPHGHTALWPHE